MWHPSGQLIWLKGRRRSVDKPTRICVQVQLGVGRHAARRAEQGRQIRKYGEDGKVDATGQYSDQRRAPPAYLLLFRLVTHGMAPKTPYSPVREANPAPPITNTKSQPDRSQLAR